MYQYNWLFPIIWFWLDASAQLIRLYVDKAYNLTAIYNGNEYLNVSEPSLQLLITLDTLATEQNDIATYYESAPTPFSKTLYNTSGSTTTSMILTANIG